MITHDYKLIFIHLPKTGGRTVCDAFNQRFDHFTAQYYRKEYLPYFPEYTMFAIVRNPFDRLVSMFHYIKEHRRHVNEAVYNLGRAGHHPTFEQWLEYNIKNAKPFPFTSPEGNRGTDGLLGSPHYFSSCVRRLGHKVDDVTLLRFEDGFDRIGEQVSEMAGAKVTFGHENRSSHGDYRTFYTPELVELLQGWEPFMEDLSIFGYSFE